MTTVIKTLNELKRILSTSSTSLPSQRPIGFVPTMGALHAGHISLINAARKNSKTVIVSIFVNPIQFGPNEDFEKYPRDLKTDIKICEQNNVDIIFAPDRKEIYPTKESEKELIIAPKELTNILCGVKRTAHFEGVATVIKRFFDIIQPNHAYFGEKDLQQLYIIRWLVREYNLPIKIISCPTLRDEKGLACSSRNSYFNEHQRNIALNLYKSLKLAKDNTKIGIFTIRRVIVECLVYLATFPEIKVEYFEARDKDNLNKVDDFKHNGFYYLVAAHIGNVRLIDNLEV